jgi:hypothetical protein
VVLLLVRRVLGLVGSGGSPETKDLQIAVLRHQLAVPAATSPGRATGRPTG